MPQHVQVEGGGHAERVGIGGLEDLGRLDQVDTDQQPAAVRVRTQPVQINAGETVRVRGDAQPLVGSLVVTAEETGAEVELDGMSVGFTPVVVRNVPVGMHRVRVKARGFILQASYRVANRPDGARVPVIHLYGRLADGGTFLVRDDRQWPHFYIRAADAHRARALRMPEPQTVDRRTFGGEAVARIQVEVPSDVPMLRDRLHSAGIDTFEADVRVTTRRRQMGDIGITAQRYSLVLYGNSQELKLEPWEPETERTVTVPFAWKPDAWYHLKLRVQNAADGSVRIQGKGWPTGQPEPAEWQIDKMDTMGNTQGAPGIFAFAQFGAYVDNIKLAAN